MPHTTNPQAAYLDACVEAQHAGVSDADVAMLTEIGEDLVKFSQVLQSKMARLKEGAAASFTMGRPDVYGHPKSAFSPPEPTSMVGLLVQTFEEDGYGYWLDHAPVIVAAAALYLERPSGGAWPEISPAIAGEIAGRLKLGGYPFDCAMAGVPVRWDEGHYHLKPGQSFLKYVDGKRTKAGYRKAIDAYLRSRRYEVVRRLQPLLEALGFRVVDERPGQAPTFEFITDPARDLGLEPATDFARAA